MVFSALPRPRLFSVTDVSLSTVIALNPTKQLGAYHDPSPLRMIDLYSPLIWFSWCHRLLSLERILEEGQDEGPGVLVTAYYAPVTVPTLLSIYL